MHILNVGAGGRCHPDWVNLDLMARPLDLHQLLIDAGFDTVDIVPQDKSALAVFADFDQDERGELQPGSIYAEATA